MKNSLTLILLNGIFVAALFISSCNNSGDGGSKNNDTLKKDTANKDTLIQNQGSAWPDGKIDTSEVLKSLGIEKMPNTNIPPNGTLVIDKPSVFFPLIEMGDNSKIIVDPKLRSVDVIIWDGHFGKNCQIVGDGKRGKDGPHNPDDPWNNGWWQHSPNTDGRNGFPGMPGNRGDDAQRLNFKIGLSEIGTLFIHSNGGMGGNGSQGCQGEFGGRQTTAGALGGHQGRGGVGGVGGRAGDGGNGGNVMVNLWMNTNAIPAPTPQILTLDAEAGLPGKPGAGGPGGANDGGGGAPAGPIGTQGQKGIKGVTTLNIIPKPASLKAFFTAQNTKTK